LILVVLSPNELAKSQKVFNSSSEDLKNPFGAFFERKIALIIISQHPSRTKEIINKTPNTIVFVK